MSAAGAAGAGGTPVDERFDAAIAAIDAANAEDPFTIDVDGEARPKELTHAEMMTAWVRRLDPDATVEQLLAARAHHLRRWVVPRSSYPEGRAGYVQWRLVLRRRHAADVAEILEGVGYGPEVVERVRQIVGKDRLKSDPAVQTHEDALCLVFLQTQFDDLAEQLGDDHTVEVLRKTLKKMTPRGTEAALGLSFSERGGRLLQRAIDGDGPS